METVDQGNSPGPLHSLIAIEESLSDVWNQNTSHFEQEKQRNEYAKMDVSKQKKKHRRKKHKKNTAPQMNTSEEDEEREHDQEDKRKKKKKKKNLKNVEEEVEVDVHVLSSTKTGFDQSNSKKSGYDQSNNAGTSFDQSNRAKASYDQLNSNIEIENKDAEDNRKDSNQYLTIQQEMFERKKRVSWKGSSELIMMREIDSYDDTASQSSEGAEYFEGYCWHPELHGPNMLVLADQPDVIRRLPAKQQTDGAMGCYGYSEGRHLFEFEFNDKPWGSHCSIGICTDEATTTLPGYNTLFGRDVCSWAWDIPSGRMIHDRQVASWCPEDPSDLPRNLQMLLDFDQDELTFIIDGEEMHAFTGLREVNAKLYPCVSLVYGLSEVRVTLKETSLPYPWLEEEEAAVVEEKPEEVADEEKEEEVESINDEQIVKVAVRKSGEEEEEEVAGEYQEDGKDVDGNDNKDNGNGEEEDGNDKEEEGKDKVEEDNGKIMQGKDNEEDVSDIKSDGKDEEEEGNDTEKEGKDSDVEGNDVEQEVNDTKDDGSEQKDDGNEQKDDCAAEIEEVTDAEEDDSDTGVNNEGGIFENEATENEQKEKDDNDDTISVESEVDIANEIKSDETSEREGEEKETETERERTPMTPDPYEMERRQLSRVSNSDNSYMVTLQSTIHEDTEMDILPTPTYSAPKKKVKLAEVDTMAPATYESPPQSELSRQETFTTFLDDETESEIGDDDAEEYVEVGELGEEDEYMLNIAHGWDSINRGGQLLPYPNIPYICVPMPMFGDKVQMVRGRQGVSRGVHTWLLSELRFYSATAGRRASGNKLLIGLVSDCHRTFNFGFSAPSSIGPYAWLWDPSTRLVWHDKEKEGYFPDEYGVIQLADDQPKHNFDLTKGIEMTFNKRGRHLVITYDGEQVAEIQNICGKKLYPAVVFNGRGVFPLEIKYLEGPKSFIQDTLKSIHKLPSYERADFHNSRSLTRQLSSKFNSDLLENGSETAYNFGAYSTGLELTGFLTAKNVVRQVSLPSNPRAQNLVLAAKPLTGFGSRHKIDFITEKHENYVYGLVSADFDKLALSDGSHGSKKYEEFPLLGSNNQSWAWEPYRQEIRHAGKVIGRYPSSHTAFDVTRYNRLRLTVDFGSTGYHTCSWAAINDDTGSERDLGLAFVAIPDQVWPGVGVASRVIDNSQLKMEYHSGPEHMLMDMRRSVTCTLL